MYPQRELTRLAAHKAALRGHIGRRRLQCAQAASQLVQPFAWLGRALALGRQLQPLVAAGLAPLGLLAARTFFPRSKILGALARWGPLAFGAVRGLAATLTKR